MAIHFYKMHGAGNDFMLIDLRRAPSAPTIDADRVRSWSDRHTGVGFDQLLVLYSSPRDTIQARVGIWNADGSSAEQCGNGMRAIGLYLAHSDGPEGGEFTLEGPADDIGLTHRGGDQVSVVMGRPRFQPEAVPLRGVETRPGHLHTLDLDGRSVRFGALSMGNPHVVIEVDDLANAPVDELGRALRDHEAFPESCNVGFAQVLAEDRIALRVLERGAGETRACGSGACAAVAWLFRQGRVGSRVRVETGGGTLEVETDADAGSVILTGPATQVFEGTIE